METRGIWTDLIAGVGLQIAEVFNQAQEEYQPGIFNLLNKLGGSGAQRNVTGKTGVGELSRFDDGDDLPGGRRYKTYTTKIVYNQYGKFLDVTKLTIEDAGEAFRSDLDEMKDMSIGANFSQDKSGLQLFNGGFATTADVNGYRLSLYGDLKPTFSTVHPTTVPGGSTQSNASSTGIKFSYANLETPLVALVEQKTDDGLAMSIMGKPTIVLQPSQQKEGLEVTESQLDPSTAQNTINVFKNGMGADMIVSTHLGTANGGTDTQWFVVVPNRHKLNHEVRQDPRLEQDTNIKNKVVTFTVDARWAESVTDWRRTWGSKGDLASYSS